jgi:hypothetical protein
MSPISNVIVLTLCAAHRLLVRKYIPFLNIQSRLAIQAGVHCALLFVCVCGDVGREVIRLTHSQGNLIQGQGPYLLLTPYTHGVPHVDCEGPCAVTRTNPLLPPGRKALETCPHQESKCVPREMERCTLHLGHGGLFEVLLDSSTQQHSSSYVVHCAVHTP